MTPTFIDTSLASELKNWLDCKRRFCRERVLDQYDTGDRLLSFYNQTRRYLMNLQDVKRRHAR